MRAREPESFWRENVIAVVMSFSKKMEVAEISYQEIEVLSLGSREGLTLFNNYNSASFSGGKTHNEVFRGG